LARRLPFLSAWKTDSVQKQGWLRINLIIILREEQDHEKFREDCRVVYCRKIRVFADAAGKSGYD
jgi:hypothetical protein